MRTIIAGSRSITDRETVYGAIEDARDRGFEISEVVSGTAPGVDTLGEEWAEENDVPIERFPFEEYVDEDADKPAPLLRNDAMAEYAEQAIIVWDGESAGTEYMRDKADEMELDLHRVRTDIHSLDKWETE